MSRKTDTVVASTIGIDTGKNTLHLIGLDDRGAIVLREKLTRGRIAARLANVPQCLIGIEAGMATHCVARELIALGHDVKQVPPVYAKPFRQGHKNDFRDAHAIAEAVQRPSTRCVPVKTDDQLDLQALHRVRERLMARRTSVINQIRAFLLERGIVFAKSPIRLREAIPDVLENANENLTPRMRNLVAMLWSEWKDLELQIVEMNDEVERIASSDDACRRLRQIPGIGPLVATAIVASIGNGAAFHKGREFAAWMGLLPKQHSTGGKARLSGISKRGNRYLRKILVHGARAVVLRSKRDRIAMGAWITSLERRAPRNVLIVAMANKLARIAWAVLSTGQDYRAVPDTVAA